MSDVVKDIPRYLRSMANDPTLHSSIDMNVLNRAAKDLEAQSTLITELVGALEPFARFGEFIDLETEGFHSGQEFELMIGDHLMETFKVSDFSASLAALTKAKDQTNDR